jgi:hypothetical protein
MPARKPPVADCLWIAFAAFIAVGFAVTVIGAIRTSLDRGAPGPLIPIPLGAVWSGGSPSEHGAAPAGAQHAADESVDRGVATRDLSRAKHPLP